MHFRATIILLAWSWTTVVAQQQIVRYYHPLFSPTLSQQASGPIGVIRALVVGIDKYQHGSPIPAGHARRDAEAFAAFLKTPAGGTVAWTDLVLLTNEQATSARVTDALDWMVSESRLGDKIIVFFSLQGLLTGHNDAQLLFYDAAPQPPQTSYLELSRLFSLLGTAGSRQNTRIFTAVELQLRNPDDAKPEAWTGSARRGGLFTEKIALQAFSADSAANSITLGNALLRGLLGMADANSDEQVHAPELLEFLRMPPAKQPAAIPLYGLLAFSDRQEWLSKSSTHTRDKLIRGVESPGTAILQLEVKSLDRFISEHADQHAQRWYEDFILAIRLGQLIDPPDRCAAALLDSLLQVEALTPVRRQLERRMAVGYLDESQQAINAYLQTSAQELVRRRKDQDHYQRYPLYMARALDILGEGNFMAPLLNLKRLYFEALALRLEAQQTGDTVLLPAQAMIKLWQAVAIEPEAAFVYNEMGVVSFIMKQYEAAENYFQLALDRSPTWGIPQANQSLSLLRRDLLPEARDAGIKAISLSSWNPQPYQILAEVYMKMGDLPTAADMYRRVLKLDPENALAHYNLACLHALQGRPELALTSLEQAFKYGYYDEKHVREDADLSTLHGTAAFEKLMARVFK
ncbi:MAG: tetratricopeptide repeat protein [Lewinellaceae bacterium]|nr:tetratricopeptide repeat protein [Saprospiraceae bacterium]MCB9331051.1 tetratricopeptide repeat protein [Lewinellaceae bacterium]